LEFLSYKEQKKLWIKVALQSFGGPAGQISVMHKLLVEEKKIISAERFLHALNFCMLLPGPEAQQLATYLGWLLGGWRGGVLAGGLFILPGFISILILSYLYVYLSDMRFVQGMFYGLKPAVVAIVMAALWKISHKALVTPIHWMIASLGFIALFFLNLSFPLVIIFAAIIGIIWGRVHEHHEVFPPHDPLPAAESSIKTFLLWLIVWMAPLFLVYIIFGHGSVFHQMNVFFSKMSLVSFGGAYAALNYVGQKAVEVHGWILGSEMIDGLAMAETTPGPLIQTVQFVAFLGAYRYPDFISPGVSAFIASVLATWMTFAPSFLWIFTFAPYVEFLKRLPLLNDALKAITAAVVGVILNLAVWFVLKTIFLPGGIDFWAMGICAIAMAMQFLLKKGTFALLIVSMLLGISIKIFL